MEAVRPELDHPVPVDEQLRLLIRAMTPSWHEVAACIGADPDLFFSGRRAACERYCEACPVAQVCLWSAIDAELGVSGERYGVFGGAGPDSRDRIARQLGPDTVQVLLGEALEVWAGRDDRTVPSGLAEMVLADRELAARLKRERQGATRQKAAA